MVHQVAYIEGGVAAPKGIRAAGMHAGIAANPDKLDLALVVADTDEPVAAGMFTTNVFASAPVRVSREIVADGRARAVILNCANANAATGQPGLETAWQVSEMTAWALGAGRDEVLVGSTGVIGVPLPVEPFVQAVPQLVDKLSKNGAHDAACAIMTTDTHPKECAVQFESNGVTYTVGGMCKGSGMIQPNMATMLAVITTDAPVSSELAHAVLKEAVDASFNKVTVDSDTSTNDSVFFLSSGAAGGFSIENTGSAYLSFKEAVCAVCENLARQIAADGEGATKLVTVNVTGAASPEDADKAARTVANSPLVKTCIAGHDCNWGRVAAALGRSGAKFAQEHVDIDMLGLPVCRAGLTVPFDEDEALRRFEEPEVVIDIDLHEGDAATRIWTCDMTHDYISINADYRS